ncbi:MAG: ATP-binding protein [Vulcanisaeta sp. AZ3]
MERIKLPFASMIIEFTDRDRALEQINEWAERGMSLPVVSFGPEGCGKTAILKQAAHMLRELGYNVFYINPLESEFMAEIEDKDVKKQFFEIVQEAIKSERWSWIANSVILLTRELLKRRKRKIAVIVDDAFQAIGLDKAAAYVKGLLGLIEHPPQPYDRIIAIAATSEGVSRAEIGRHLWSKLIPTWNMPKKGFEELYEKIPGQKPSFEEVWQWTGGNPRILSMLYEANWNYEKVIQNFIEKKKLDNFVFTLSQEEREWLADAIEDPDSLYARERIPLMNKLVEMNLLIDEIHYRDPDLWIDQPPPKKDLELGIGSKAAWQTPIHKKAIKQALQNTQKTP